jgi:hypothetical protein
MTWSGPVLLAYAAGAATTVARPSMATTAEKNTVARVVASSLFVSTVGRISTGG